jgi:aminopeptidase YwaD
MDVDLERLRSHIAQLAGAPRPAESLQLEAARRYVGHCFEEAGWLVKRHPFQSVGDDGLNRSGVNLIARHGRFSGSRPVLCVGAHLDSRPDTPGADDNASGVAALLEIARLLPHNWPVQPELDLELAAFDLEENGMLGGAEHARLSRSGGVDLRGMISLEMLGYCDHRPGSQLLPRQLVGQYPETGNFIAVIGNQNSETLIARFRQGAETVATLPVESLLVPDNGNSLQATRLSDHSPFWDAGYPALMITDTSFLRNPHYHMPSDTLETLDFDFLGRVSQGCLAAVRELIAAGL